MSGIPTLDSLYFSAEIWGGVFSLIAVFVIFLTRKHDAESAKRLIRVMLCSTAIMLSDGLYRYVTASDDLSLLVLRCLRFSMLFFAFLIIPLIADYVSNLIFTRTGDLLYWNLIEWGLFAAGTIALVVNIFIPYIYMIDDQGNYRNMPQFPWMPGLVVFVGLMMSIRVILVYRKQLSRMESFALSSLLALPMIAIVLQLIVPERWYLSLAVVASTMILFISYEIGHSQLLIDKEKQLMDQQLRVINRQIQPHFIFNSLVLIRNQCKENPKAVETINEFSRFLRDTTDLMIETDCVSVERELDLVRNFCNIQRKRFGENVRVNYDITDTDFDVPPFSIQTLVENSLHHGILDGQLEDGEIVIATSRVGKEHIITICDNGVGFDVDELPDQTDNHIGIINTRERLASMCDGRIEIESAPDKGTKVTITIPA